MDLLLPSVDHERYKIRLWCVYWTFPQKDHYLGPCFGWLDVLARFATHLDFVLLGVDRPCLE